MAYPEAIPVDESVRGAMPVYAESVALPVADSQAPAAIQITPGRILRALRRRWLLALLAAVTGFCTGCEAYKLGCRLTGRPFVSCPLPPEPHAAG